MAPSGTLVDDPERDRSRIQRTGTAMTREPVNPSDPRWGGRIPRQLRFPEINIPGDIRGFFQHVSRRLDHFATFNEGHLPNVSYLGAKLEAASFGLFRVSTRGNPAKEIGEYFSPVSLPEPRPPAFPGGLIAMAVDATRRADEQRAEQKFTAERLSVLESLLSIIPREAGLLQLIDDIRGSFAYFEIPLDIMGDPPLIVPVEEPLLQQAVLERLFPTISVNWPAQAQELIRAYRRLISGDSPNSIFGDAFKALEEIARGLTSNPSFVFDKKHLARHFPDLHPTIHARIGKLAAHRGDKGSHGATGPQPHEIRYLLLEICNTALLLVGCPTVKG